MAMTAAKLRYLTQYIVGDPQMSTYSQQMYEDAMTFAVKDYCTKTGVSYVETTVTPDNTGMVKIPTPHIKIYRVSYGPNFLVESTMSFEYMKNPAWPTTVSTIPPRRWLQWSGNRIKITPLQASYTLSCTLGYVEAPPQISETVTTAGNFVVGKSYQVLNPGNTDFTLVGAVDSNPGTNFVATGVGAGTGTTSDITDLRVPDIHCEYLKYSAGAWLLLIDGDGQDFQKAGNLMDKFNSLIGFSQPVLAEKVASTRTQAEREV